MTLLKNDTTVAAKECVAHFRQLMGISTPQPWVKLTRGLLDEHGLSPDELKDFMTWAATKNISDTPQFSSVDYLAKANDPMVTLVKHATNLIKVWRNQQTRRTGRKIFWKGEFSCHTCRGDGFVEPVHTEKPGAKKLTACPNCKCGYHLMPERKFVPQSEWSKYEKFDVGFDDTTGFSATK